MLPDLIATLRAAPSIWHKQDIQTAAIALGQYVPDAAGNPIRLGDDCAAIPDGDGYLLLAAEGIWPQLVTQDPWFAGWCAVMVNLSDIAAMGGRAIAIVDALWSQSTEASQPLLKGMQDAANAYGIPIVGGHTNTHSPYDGLAVAIMGRSQHLITSFEAQPGDSLMVAINLEGTYYGDYSFWNAATTADPAQLKKQLALLPKLAESGLCSAGKDISMGGLAGTLLMLCEASGCGALLDLEGIPKPANTDWHKWLTSFPSFGFLLSVPPANAQQVTDLFSLQGITCQTVGEIIANPQVSIQHFGESALFWEGKSPLTGFGNARAATQKATQKAAAESDKNVS
ncbi:MAG: sll0787 family AIR synthase-like protein [Cyanobacteria bacterium J06634_5]